MARSKRETERPKRYMSSFLIFLGEFRKRNSSRYSNTEMVKKGGAAWKKLPSRDRHPYENASMKLKKKYDIAIKKYKEMRKSLPRKERSEQDSVKTNLKDPNRPKKPLTSYMLFMSDYRKQNAKKGYDVTEMMSRGAQEWQTLSNKELAPYTEEASRRSARFRKELAKYKQKQKRSSTKKTPATETEKPTKTSKINLKSSKSSSGSQRGKNNSTKKIPDTKTKAPNRDSKKDRRNSSKSTSVRAKSKRKSTVRRDNSRRR